MSESFKETLNLLKDSNLDDFSKYTYRGIEKESLRVSGSTISETDHPKSLGSTLTNQFITTDFSEALLELITNKQSSVDASLGQLEDVLNYVYLNCDETIWPSSVPCSIENEDKIIPANGVYAVICQLENELINGIMNIGFKPSIEENKIKTIEIHLFEFDKNIYDRYLKIKVLNRIRDEVKFSSIEKLKIQISKDIKEAQNIINRY